MKYKRPVIIGVIVAGALGFLLVSGLGNATMYFRTVDEAIAQRSLLGEQRFRIQGTVLPGTISPDGKFTSFVIAGKNEQVNVRNSGEPLGIFQENIPVVLEGHFEKGSNLFESDCIMVKHSEEYVADHPDRVQPPK